MTYKNLCKFDSLYITVNNSIKLTRKKMHSILTESKQLAIDFET